MTATALREHSWTLEPGPCAPSVARAYVRDTLRAWGLAPLVEDATLVVSELVTNAVVHARPDIVLSLHRHGSAVRGEVVDHGPVWKESRPVAVDDLGAESGRGLAIVDALAYRWGVDPLPSMGGKVAWFMLTAGAS